MYVQVLPLQFGSAIADTVGKVAASAGVIVLMLMIAALVGFAYKSLRGDGIEWPDDAEAGEGGPGSDDEVVTGDEDDEWDYY